MGGANSAHVKVLETVPFAGAVAAIVHMIKGNFTEFGRALMVQTATCCAVGGIALYVNHATRSLIYAGLVNATIAGLAGIYALNKYSIDEDGALMNDDIFIKPKSLSCFDYDKPYKLAIKQQ